jgi:hypothetical protein
MEDSAVQAGRLPESPGKEKGSVVIFGFLLGEVAGDLPSLLNAPDVHSKTGQNLVIATGLAFKGQEDLKYVAYNPTELAFSRRRAQADNS